MTSSLWTAWPDVAARLTSAGSLALLLDYDGTLAPIAPHPSQATVSAVTRRLLGRLAQEPGVWVALVSGRALRDLARMVRVRALYYVGNHGLEVAGPRLRYVNPIAQRRRPLMARLVGELGEAVQAFPGAWVEDKGLTLTVHYRGVAPAAIPPLQASVDEVIRPFRAQQSCVVTEGKCVIEIRPPVQWTKGTIVRWLVVRLAALSATGPVLPVYVGDDATDEDAFQALRGDGITIAVGPDDRPTAAHYRVASPAEVRRFLRRVCTLRRRTEG